MQNNLIRSSRTLIKRPWKKARVEEDPPTVSVSLSHQKQLFEEVLKYE